MCKIVVVGSLNMDLVIKADRRPEVGETILGTSFNTFCGGKGFNQAVAAARLGAHVEMIGMVGRDDFGAQFKKTLKKEGIFTESIFLSEKKKTGIGSPVIDSHGNNSIIVVPGANMDFRRDHVEASRQSILSADLVMLQLEIPIDTILAVVEITATASIPVLLNPAPYTILPDELLERIAFFIPNEVECEKFSGVKVVDAFSAEHAARILREKGVHTVIITLGEQGSFVDDGKSRELIPSFSVNAVDTTAAGDAFCAAFAYSMIKDRSLKTAVRFANAVGAITTTKHGAEPSLPNIAEVDAFLKNNRNE